MRPFIVLIASLAATGALADPPAAPAPPTGKAAACRSQIAGQNLRGPERSDALLVCMAEARLDCTKEMVAAHTTPDKRKDYMQGCLGPPR